MEKLGEKIGKFIALLGIIMFFANGIIFCIMDLISGEFSTVGLVLLAISLFFIFIGNILMRFLK